MITDARAHCDTREQCACSRSLVYALSYVVWLLALFAQLRFPDSVSIHWNILRCVAALSRASALMMIAFINIKSSLVPLIEAQSEQNMQLSDVPAAVQLQVRHHRHVSPAVVSYPKSIWFSDR